MKYLVTQADLPPCDLGCLGLALKADLSFAATPMTQQVRRRLRWKQSVTTQVSIEQLSMHPSSMDLEELTVEGPRDGKKQIYLVTLPHPRAVYLSHGSNLRCTSTMTREDVRNMILDAIRNPVYIDAAAAHRTSSVDVGKLVVYREFHEMDANGVAHPHFHVPLQLTVASRFVAFKRALAQRHSVASHWSCTHEGYWSAVRYGFMPTPKKPRTALDEAPLVWSLHGPHPSLFEASQQPVTATAMRRRREQKVMSASEAAEVEPRATELDLYAIIVQHKFRNTDENPWAHKQLIEHLRSHASTKVYELAWKMRHKPKGLIDDVWMWETIADDVKFLSQTRWEALITSSRGPCCCAGRWRQCAEYSLDANGVNKVELCAYVCHALRVGRSESSPVVTLMGRSGGEGKSFFFSPLPLIYGEQYTQRSPQRGNFPLLDLDQKRIAVLDEWDFSSEILPVSTQLLWFEGKAFPITRPQNDKEAKGHLLYSGKAPIFVTTKEKHLGKIVETAHREQMEGEASEASMLLRRLKIFSFSVKLPMEPGVQIPTCPACFAQMVMYYSSLAA